MHRLLVLAVVIAALLSVAQPAEASRYVRYGLQDDAWLVYGPGTLDERMAELDRIGVDLVRFTINWHQVEKVRDERRWGSADAVLEGLRDHGIAPVVTLYGAPRWANGGRAPSWAPTSGSTFAALRVRCRETLSVGEAVARLERAEPAPLAAPHDSEHATSPSCSTPPTRRFTARAPAPRSAAA